MSGECILCGKCLEVCPLLRATGREELGPRAKADLCRLLSEDTDMLSETDVARLEGLCLGCGRCREVCSQGVDVPALVAGLRGAHPDFKTWLWKTWLKHAKKLWSPGSAAAKRIPEQFHSEKIGPMLKMLAGLKGGAGLEPCLEVTQYPDTYRGQNMLLFAGCTANFVQTRWLMTALKLLDGMGVEVLPGDFKCCGSGLKAAGFADDASAMSAHNVQVWRDVGRPPVVTFCASCRAGLQAYDGCFWSAEEQEVWENTLVPLSSVLRDVSFVLSTNVSKALGYHQPCHVRGDDSDRTLLNHALKGRITGATGRECCGFGGVMRLAAPGLADPVNRQCWDTLAGADVVVTGCSACVAQLAATAPDSVTVGHWLELIR
nr:(Fe-S)-binding protein [uncultured Pseudodesulfovibrio sp.]